MGAGGGVSWQEKCLSITCDIMNRITLRLVAGVQFLMAGTSGLVFGQINYTGDTVTCLTNQTQLRHGTDTVVVSDTISLAEGITVSTNCTFKVNEGKERPLQEGQLLRADGFLLNADGSIMPVRDHVAMGKGTVKVCRDGVCEPLRATLTLGDGTAINPDGSYGRPSGRRSRLVDGQLVALDGTPLQGMDTISMHGGRVVVYKSGALIPLQSAVVIMGMSDGSRVRGDGQITAQNGTITQLAEGQTITVPGLLVNW
jgi:Domain of unknown function (DUF6799)